MIFVIYGSIWSLKNGVLGLMVVGHVNIKIKKKNGGTKLLPFQNFNDQIGTFLIWGAKIKPMPNFKFNKYN